MSVNLPLLTSVLSIACIITVGRHKWYGHLFGVMNCIVFTVIALHGQWGYIPSNVICFGLYVRNAWQWRQNGNVGKMDSALAAQNRERDARSEQLVPDAEERRLVLAEGGLQESADSREVCVTA